MGKVLFRLRELSIFLGLREETREVAGENEQIRKR